MKLDLPKKKIGEIIQAKRNAQGVSQGNLAKKLKCNTQLISNVERGLCIPKNELFKRILIELKFNDNESSQIATVLRDSFEKTIIEEILP